MSNLFESIELIGDMQRTASRQALKMSMRRADIHFGEFLRASSSKEELAARQEMIADDLRSLVTATCQEFDHEDIDSVLASVEGSLGVTRESRRPKMCPFHREVTDISLSTGDPNSGFNAMSQHAFGESSCRGNWEGSCNWKPDMVKQEYWDKRNEDLKKRQEEREQQNMRVQPGGLPEDSRNPSHEGDESPEDLTGYQGVDIDEALEGAPTAVGTGDRAELGDPITDSSSFDSGPKSPEIVPFLSSTHEANQYIKQRGDKWVVLNKDGKVLSEHDSKDKAEGSFRAMERSKHSQKLHQAMEGSTLEEHIGPWTMKWSGGPYAEIYHAESPSPLDVINVYDYEQGAPNENAAQELPQRFQEWVRDNGEQFSGEMPYMASIHQALTPKGEAAVTGDSYEENESPNMKNDSDESFASGFGQEPSGFTLNPATWSPETVKPIETDNPKGRNPSELQDINQPADYQGNPFEDDGRFEHTQAVTTTEELPSAGFEDAGFNSDITVRPNADTRTWDRGYGDSSQVLKQQKPVMPEALSSFLNPDEVERAIVNYRAR